MHVPEFCDRVVIFLYHSAEFQKGKSFVVVYQNNEIPLFWKESSVVLFIPDIYNNNTQTNYS